MQLAPSTLPAEGDEQLSAGMPFGRYVVTRELGVGGMGAVYEATHTEMRKRVALKTLHREFVQDPDARARFLREGEALARIQHPNVVDILDVGVHDGIPFLVMELLEGENLRDVLSRTGALPERQLAQVMLPLVAGLSAVHRAGIVHRDLKPENVFLAHDEHEEVVPKLVDFGISKEVAAPQPQLTLDNAVVGTPYYMSPEQTRGDDALDARSDQYSLGVVFYECLTGHLPFDGATLVDIFVNISRGEFLRPSMIRRDVTPELEEIVLRAMALRPEDRFPTMAELGRALLPFVSTRMRLRYARQLGVHAPDSVPPILPRVSHVTARVVVPGPPPVPAVSAPPPDATFDLDLPPVLAVPNVVAAEAQRPGQAIAPPPMPRKPAPGRATLRERRMRRSFAASLGVLGALLALGEAAILYVLSGPVHADAAHEAWLQDAPRGAPSGTHAPPTTYALSLRTRPRAAHIVLDGELAGIGALDRWLARDGREHELTLSLDGYEPRTFRFRDDAPVTGEVALAPVPFGLEPPPLAARARGHLTQVARVATRGPLAIGASAPARANLDAPARPVAPTQQRSATAATEADPATRAAEPDVAAPVPAVAPATSASATPAASATATPTASTEPATSSDTL